MSKLDKRFPDKETTAVIKGSLMNIDPLKDMRPLTIIEYLRTLRNMYIVQNEIG